MVKIRQAITSDLLGMQQCNLKNLPENYTFRYYLYHGVCWPQLLQVAEDDKGKIVGYVMAKLEEDEDKKKKGVEAHVTSLSVLKTHRKLGIATKLMRATHHQMKNVFQCDFVSLHVRVSNIAALTLYRDVLGYEVRAIDPSYYADKEDAYDMRLVFN
jgi:ribosomal protein S18 acetylase RimI-like enzyme